MLLRGSIFPSDPEHSTLLRPSKCHMPFCSDSLKAFSSVFCESSTVNYLPSSATRWLLSWELCELNSPCWKWRCWVWLVTRNISIFASAECLHCAPACRRARISTAELVCLENCFIRQCKQMWAEQRRSSLIKQQRGGFIQTPRSDS